MKHDYETERALYNKKTLKLLCWLGFIIFILVIFLTISIYKENALWIIVCTVFLGGTIFSFYILYKNYLFHKNGMKLDDPFLKIPLAESVMQIQDELTKGEYQEILSSQATDMLAALIVLKHRDNDELLQKVKTILNIKFKI